MKPLNVIKELGLPSKASYAKGLSSCWNKRERQEKTRFDQNPPENFEDFLMPSIALDLVFFLPFCGFGLMINPRAREL